ncbi:MULTISPECIES: restriction endonuclease subunit S [unclassified Empedobacter]|uniref:restriction endonuclease subunit S n=1 Tax=unclassified Empedobacter TaxID=2643773 RepID=UPI0025BDD463|nr:MULTISPECIES: restriction endonuclease subunit S [unclassified Empedobacter]
MNSDNKIIPNYRFPEFKDDGSWDVDVVKNLIKTITPPKKLNSNEYLKEGDYPIVDQSKSFYCGYSNDKEALISPENDLIVFGDHTCITKYINHPFIQGADGIKIFSTKKSVLPNYFYQYLQYNPVKQEEYKRHFSILKEKVISYPTNPVEQQKIAACLSSLDDVIAGHEEKLTALEEHKKGLMQNLFPQEGETQPKFRFPEFENDGDWVEKTIIDTADKNIKWSFTGGPFGSNLKSSDYTFKGIRIIQLQNIGDGIFNDEYKIFTSLDKADELLSCNIYSGDIILSKMGDPVGRACIMPGDNERYLMASDGIRLAVNEKEFSKYFIFSLINSDTIRSKIEAKSTGSTRKRIGLDVLKQIPLLIPKTLNEQQKIASVLSSVDELIVAQREKIASLKEHKKGLMQGLFPKIES